MFGISAFFNKDQGSSKDKTTYTPYDPEARGRIADIANRGMDMAEEAWSLYQTDFLPYEREIMAANRRLLPQQTEATRLGLEETMRDIEINRPVKEAAGLASEKFYQQAAEGVDPEIRMGEATADVQQGFGQSWAEMKRELARAGIQPGSSKYQELMADMIYNKAKSVAGARTTARRTAENESFGRLTTATGLAGRPTDTTPYAYGATPGATDPSGKVAGFMGGAASATATGLTPQAVRGRGFTTGQQWGMSGSAGTATYKP